MITKKAGADDAFNSLLRDSNPKANRTKKSRKPRPKSATLQDLKLITAVPIAEPELAPISSETDEMGALQVENCGLKERIAFLEREIQEYEALNPTLADVLGKTTTSDLVAALVPKAIGAFQSLISTIQSMNSHLQSIERQIGASQATKSERTKTRKKIVVIGVLSRQIPDIERQIEHLPCDCKFLAAEGPLNVGNADHIIVWTDFINHSVTDRLKGDKRVVLSHGGLKNLANDIRRLASSNEF